MKKALSKTTHIFTLTLFLTSCITESGHIPASMIDEYEYTITAMTYNILHGAGVDSTMERISARQGYPGNRLMSILAAIEAAQPDILGIQEANTWDRDDDFLAKQVADSLEVNYRLVKSPTGHHLALYTKFDILQITAYNDRTVFTRAALHATLMPPWGRAIEVFLVHLHPNPADTTTKDREVRFLIDVLEPHKDADTILLGDMNWWIANSRWHEMLKSEGWEVVAGSYGGRWEVDEIRTTTQLSATAQAVDPVNKLQLSKSMLDKASDHYPAIVKIDWPRVKS